MIKHKSTNQKKKSNYGHQENLNEFQKVQRFYVPFSNRNLIVNQKFTRKINLKGKKKKQSPYNKDLLIQVVPI